MTILAVAARYLIGLPLSSLYRSTCSLVAIMYALHTREDIQAVIWDKQSGMAIKAGPRRRLKR